MIILAVDPGTDCSAWVLFDTKAKALVRCGQAPNEEVLAAIDETGAKALVVEMFKSYGNVMGDSVLQTCVWIGRFVQEWQEKVGLPFTLVPRKTIVTELTGNARGNDANVRAALIDLWGGKKKAIGNKAAPGPLYGVKSDIWSALAIAVAWTDMQERLDNALK